MEKPKTIEVGQRWTQGAALPMTFTVIEKRRDREERWTCTWDDGVRGAYTAVTIMSGDFVGYAPGYGPQPSEAPREAPAVCSTAETARYLVEGWKTHHDFHVDRVHELAIIAQITSALDVRAAQPVPADCVPEKPPVHVIPYPKLEPGFYGKGIGEMLEKRTNPQDLSWSERRDGNGVPLTAIEAIRSRPKPEPWIPSVDEWDLLPDV